MGKFLVLLIGKVAFGAILLWVVVFPGLDTLAANIPETGIVVAAIQNSLGAMFGGLPSEPHEIEATATKTVGFLEAIAQPAQSFASKWQNWIGVLVLFGVVNLGYGLYKHKSLIKFVSGTLDAGKGSWAGIIALLAIGVFVLLLVSGGVVDILMKSGPTMILVAILMQLWMGKDYWIDRIKDIVIGALTAAGIVLGICVVLGMYGTPQSIIQVNDYSPLAGKIMGWSYFAIGQNLPDIVLVIIAAGTLVASVIQYIMAKKPPAKADSKK